MRTRRKSFWSDFTGVVVMLLAFWFFASSCHGELLDTTGWRASRSVHTVAAQSQGSDPRVRVTVVCPDGTLSIGSGAMVAWGNEPRVALTVSHLFDDGVKSISVCVAERGCFPAELLGQDKENDLAALRVTGLTDYLVYPIVETDPPIGTVVDLHGYGPGKGSPQVFSGRVVGRADFRTESGDGLLLLTGDIRNGDSGGPITVLEGIVGVISCSAGGSPEGGEASSTMVYYQSDVQWATVGPTCSRIRGFFGRLFPRLASRPPPGRRIGPPVGTVPRDGMVPVMPVLPGPAPRQDLPWPVHVPPDPAATCPPGGCSTPQPSILNPMAPPIPTEPWTPIRPPVGDDGLVEVKGRLTAVEGRVSTLEVTVAAKCNQDQTKLAADIGASLALNQVFIQAIASQIPATAQPMTDDQIDAIADKVRQRISGEIRYEWIPETSIGEK